MIHEVDQAIESVIRQEALQGTSVEVVFDAPTKDWAARRNAPTLDAYLYDIREDLGRRAVGQWDVTDEEGGAISGRARPLRFFKLSYLITAWTQRPEDEHRLLAAILGGFLRWNSLPAYALTGSLSEQPMAIPVTIALPPPQDRAISDIWSALGGELKPSLDLVVTAPFDPYQLQPVALPVSEPLRLSVNRTTDGVSEEAGRRPSPPRLEAELAARQAAQAVKAASGREATRPRRST
jgi:Pvc16 N-terminal domain